MKPTEVIEHLGLPQNEIKTDGNKYIYTIPDSDSYSHLFNQIDNDDAFEEDLDSQDINLFTNTVVYIDVDGETECTLNADFENDKYQLRLVNA